MTMQRRGYGSQTETDRQLSGGRKARVNTDNDRRGNATQQSFSIDYGLGVDVHEHCMPVPWWHASAVLSRQLELNLSCDRLSQRPFVARGGSTQDTTRGFGTSPQTGCFC